MNLAGVLSCLSYQGVSLGLSGKKLALAPSSRVTLELVVAVKEHKEALVDLLDEQGEREAIQREHLISQVELKAALSEWEGVVAA